MNKVVFDPRLIPPESADCLAAETLRLVRRMMKIPEYRAAIEKMNRERRGRKCAKENGK